MRPLNRLVIWNDRVSPAPGDDVRRPPADGDPAVGDVAPVGREQAGDHVEQGGLAGAIRSDQGVDSAAADREGRVVEGRDAAERLGHAATLERRDLAEGSAGQECGHGARARRSLPAGHGGRRLRSRTHELEEPSGHADEPGRGEEHEDDEEKTEVEEPVAGPDRQELAEEDEEHGAQGGAEEAPCPADDDHGHELPGEGHGERVGRGEAMVEHEERSRQPGDGRGDDEGDQLVAADRVALEGGALLVLADRHQHPAERRPHHPPQKGDHHEADPGDDRVVDAGPREVHAEDGRARDGAEPALPAGERSPAVGDGEEQRRQRERQEREVHAAAAEDQRPEEEGADAHQGGGKEHGEDEPFRHQPPMDQPGGVGAHAEPGAVAERDEAGVAEQEVEAEADERVDHAVGRGDDREAHGGERGGQHEEAGAGHEERRPAADRGRPRHSSRSMRSPIRPRGRTSRTSSMRRYIDASEAGGMK